MTADYFNLRVSTDTVNMIVKGTDMKVETETYYDDFVDALLHSNSNLDYIAEPLKDVLIHRAENEQDLGTISEDELNIFKAVMAVVL